MEAMPSGYRYLAFLTFALDLDRHFERLRKLTQGYFYKKLSNPALPKPPM
jgi:hypothetical protein